MTNPYVFRSRSSYVWFSITSVLLIFMVVEALFVDKTTATRVSSLAIAVVVGLGSFLLFLRPKVVVFDEGITIVNPITTVTIGWSEVDAIETKYTMSIQRDKEVIHAWAAPAPGRHHRRHVDPGEMRGVGHAGHEIIRPGDDPATLSGAAAAIARVRWNEFARNDAISAAYNKRADYTGVLILLASALTALLVR
jgi:hypothetical protein